MPTPAASALFAPSAAMAALDLASVGIGLRQPHHGALLQQRPALGFVEVHSENFMADGGAALALLQAVRQAYPVSLHGVGLALGSAAGLDSWHLGVDRQDSSSRVSKIVKRHGKKADFASLPCV